MLLSFYYLLHFPHFYIPKKSIKSLFLREFIINFKFSIITHKNNKLYNNKIVTYRLIARKIRCTGSGCRSPTPSESNWQPQIVEVPKIDGVCFTDTGVTKISRQDLANIKVHACLDWTYGQKLNGLKRTFTVYTRFVCASYFCLFCLFLIFFKLTIYNKHF